MVVRSKTAASMAAVPRAGPSQDLRSFISTAVEWMQELTVQAQIAGLAAATWRDPLKLADRACMHV
jgi:hypothetical protein